MSLFRVFSNMWERFRILQFDAKCLKRPICFFLSLSLLLPRVFERSLFKLFEQNRLKKLAGVVDCDSKPLDNSRVVYFSMQRRLHHLNKNAW